MTKQAEVIVVGAGNAAFAAAMAASDAGASVIMLGRAPGGGVRRKFDGKFNFVVDSHSRLGEAGLIDSWTKADSRQTLSDAPVTSRRGGILPRFAARDSTREARCGRRSMLARALAEIGPAAMPVVGIETLRNSVISSSEMAFGTMSATCWPSISVFPSLDQSATPNSMGQETGRERSGGRQGCA